jgi:anti-sigma B factor antagonist
MLMTTIIRQVGGVTIVDITGRIVLGDESAALRHLVCDLLSHIVSALTSVRKQGGELKLLNLTNKVHDVMQITRLYRLRHHGRRGRGR